MTSNHSRAHVSLIARNAQETVEREDGDEIRPLLPPDTTAKLMQLAVDLHACISDSLRLLKT